MPSPVPRKLDDSMIQALCDVIRKGNYIEPACQICGIYKSTFYDWMKFAQNDALNGIESIYTSLYTAVKKAEAEAEAKMVEVVRESAEIKRDWLPAMTFLERRHPDRWGRRERHDINVEAKTLNITRVVIVKPIEEGSQDAIQRQIEAEGSQQISQPEEEGQS